MRSHFEYGMLTINWASVECGRREIGDLYASGQRSPWRPSEVAPRQRKDIGISNSENNDFQLLPYPLCDTR